MQGDAARLCFTSPPYGNQRDYTSGGIGDWDGLMRDVFGNVPMADDGQVLVNLGLIHRDNEVIPYWDAWLGWMRTQGWRRFAWYVWDQGPGMPGDWAGRFAPSFEFVFHFNRQSSKPNKIVPCKHAGQESHLRADGSSTAMRGKDGEVGGWTHKGQPTQDTRIPDSVSGRGVERWRHRDAARGRSHPRRKNRRALGRRAVLQCAPGDHLLVHGAVLRRQDSGVRGGHHRWRRLGHCDPARLDGGGSGVVGQRAELLVPRARV